MAVLFFCVQLMDTVFEEVGGELWFVFLRVFETSGLCILRCGSVVIK